MKRFLYLFIGFIFLHNAIAQNFDISHANFDLKIDPYRQYVEGINTFEMKILHPADSIVFDARSKVAITNVRINKRKADFKQKENKAIIYGKFRSNKRYRITLGYHVTSPAQALYFTGWNNRNKNQVWTQGQGKNHSHWMPFIDDVNERFTWQTTIEFPAGYEVISNGRLISRDTLSNGSVRHLYQIERPAAGYLFFVGVGEYLVEKDTVSGIPHSKYHYPDAPKPDKTFYFSNRIFKLMPELIGMAFPWSNYREIPLRDFIYGGMENVTATVFSDDYVVNDTSWNDKNPVYILAHELAHQWFGDYVTETSSRHHWIHESFATYYGREAEKEIFGKNHYEFGNYFEWEQIVKKYHEGDTVPLFNGKATSLTFYQKGAFVLRMMRNRLGREKFREVIIHFLKNHPYQNVSTSDFKRSLYAVTGDSLNDFFERWFESAEIPHYEFALRQDSLIIQTESEVLIPVRLFYRNGTYRDIKTNHSVAIPDFDNFTFYLPDPGRQFLVETRWQLDSSKMFYALRAPLSDLDFFRVLKKMRPVPLKEKMRIFMDIAAWDYYYPVHREILYQTAAADDSVRARIGRLILKHGVQNRKTVAMSFAKVPRDLQEEFEGLLHDASYETREHALYALWNSFPEKRKVYLDRTKNTYGDQSRSFRMLWIMLALNTPEYLSHESARKYLNELVDYASPDWPVSTRLTALEYIDMLRLIDKKTAAYIKQAASYFHPALRNKARKISKKYHLD